MNREPAKRKVLTHGDMIEFGAGGLPRLSVTGKPSFTLDSAGPVAKAQITKAWLLAGDTGLFITKRHVALPWEDVNQGASQPDEAIIVMD